jgi:predicted amidohydrolase YtcJ
MSVEEALDWQQRLQLTADAERMTIRGVKVFADGGYSARNAATRTEYLEEYAVEKGSKGQLDLSVDQLTNLVRRTREAGLQLAVHANGERAQDAVCEAVAAAGPAPTQSLRTRVEHAGNLVTTPATVAAWRRSGIIPVPQPVFLFNFGGFFPVYLGEPGRHGRFPFRSLVADGWQLSGSSDVLIGSEQEQTNPFFSIWCCLKRETCFGEIVDPQEAVDLQTALEMHTINAAVALGVEERRGSLAKGKVADMVLVRRDPRDLPIDDIRRLEPDATIVGGTLAYSRDDAPSRF